MKRPCSPKSHMRALPGRKFTLMRDLNNYGFARAEGPVSTTDGLMFAEQVPSRGNGKISVDNAPNALAVEKATRRNEGKREGEGGLRAER